MRGSFGGGGRGMGGGPGGGGGSMMRAVGRVAARSGVRGSGAGGLQDPFSASSANAAANSAPTSPRKDANKVVSKNQLCLSSSSLLGVPLSGPSTWQHDDEYFWVSSDGSEESEDESANVYLDKFLLGPVPSSDEVHNAVSAIQQVFDSATTPQFIRDRFGSNLDMDVCPPPSDGMMIHHVSSKGSDLDWMEPAFYQANTRSLSPYGYGSERALDAFQLLQTDSSVQKMVVSLSQDRAVWDAIMNNDVVRELRESCHEGAADETCDDSSSKESETSSVVDVVMQMFGHTKAKFADMIEKITKLVTHLFNLHSPSSSSATSDGAVPRDVFEAKVRASFMLTVVVLLTVVLSRARGT